MKLSDEMKGKTDWDEPITDEQVEDWADEVAKLEAENEAYHELIMGVENKYPGETRHETALRYIRERENQEQRVAMSAKKEDE